MITFIKCVGLIVGGLILSRIFIILIELHSEKIKKQQEEHQELLELRRKLEYEELLKEEERQAELDAKLEKIKEEYNKTHSI